MSNKRDNRRLQAVIDVATYVKNEKVNTCMRDLSCSGIMIADTSDSQFEKDKEYKIAIPVSKDKELEIDAKVVWVKDGMIGLKFSNIDDDTASKLDQLILRLNNG